MAVGQPGDALSPAPVETGLVEPLDTVTTENPVRKVGEQILDAVRAAATHGDRQVQIRLEPPELGTVIVRLREEGEHLDGTLEVGRSETRRDIERALPEVVRSLQDAGIQVRRFDVTSADTPDQGFGRGQPQQETGSGQHGSGQAREHFAASQTRESSHGGEPPKNPARDARGEHLVEAPPGRIDMLL